ncbi:MAG: tRNA pseudouridine(38-40) synthase TruA [Candidatus Zophobacter franzmannii]|nr:tRNA pseudouridine(38-40) synthase TruA [Candidatus Zophobacter franzmannii]
MIRYLVQLAYNGKKYHGWQRQINAISVQQVVEEALSRIAKTTIKISGSGRTDAGVHAICQFAHFDFPLDIPIERFSLALITALHTPHIRPLKFWKVPSGFNARFDAYERSYRYILTTNKTPFNVELKSYLPNHKLNPDLIRECLPLFEGTHNFIAFSKPNPDVPNTFCDLKKLNLEIDGHDYIFSITANRFLHNMVRRIIGCLVTISTNDLDPNLITTYLNSMTGDQRILFTAPPNGLYLVDVKYPNENIQPVHIDSF